MRRMNVKLVFLSIAILSITQSCQKEFEDVILENENFEISTKAITVPNVLDQLVGIPIRIKLVNPREGAFLYSNGTMSPVTLQNLTNDMKGKWKLTKDGNKFKLLSMNQGEQLAYIKGTDIWAYSYDRNRPGATLSWDIQTVNNNSSYYTIGGKTNYNYAYHGESSSKKGSEYTVTSFQSINNKCYWEFLPVEDFTLVSLSYQLDTDDYIKNLPAYTDEVTVSNNTPTTQSMSTTFTRKASETSSFSKTEGTSFTMSGSFKVGIPIINASGGMSSVTSTNWQYGTTETKEDSRSYNFNLTVPAHSTYKAHISVTLFETNATYIIKVKGVTTGKELTLKGKWSGITTGAISYDIYDIEGAKVKTFSYMPNQQIVLE